MTELPETSMASDVQDVGTVSRIGTFARALGGGILALLVLSWAPAAGVDADLVALVAVMLAVLQWLLPPLTTTVLLLGTCHLVNSANLEKLRINGDGLLWQDIVHVLPNIPFNLGAVLQYVDLRSFATGLLVCCALIWFAIIETRLRLASGRLAAAVTLVVAVLYMPSAHAYATRVLGDLAEFRKSGKAFAGNLYTSSLARFIHSAGLPEPKLGTNGTPASMFAERAAGLARGPARDTPSSAPDIFLVLNESQFDPMSLELCAGRTDCQLAMYKPDAHLLQGGPLRVHTHGWGTWNAEFSLMTGVPYFWFGESGFYSPYTVSPRVHLALPKHLQSLGYHTMAIYPVQKGMINAAAAYGQYGIQQFFGAEALQLPFDWCDTTDDLMYEKALEQHRALVSASSKPVFTVILTIFNHGPHGERCISPEVTSRLKHLGESRASVFKIEDYIHRSATVDRAAIAFTQRALQSPRPTLIAFVGDHQPGFEGKYSDFTHRPHRDMPTSEAYFFTQYRFLANYGMHTGHRTTAEGRELDVSFIPSTLLELAGLPEDSLFRANRQLRQICQGRLDLCGDENLLASYRQHLLDIAFFR